MIEDYFDFLSCDDIRVRGTRVGIESILYQYLHCSRAPEEIVDMFPSVTLEQVYATILYYLRNKERVRQYLSDWLEYCDRAKAEYEQNLPEVVIRLREIKKELQRERAA